MPFRLFVCLLSLAIGATGAGAQSAHRWVELAADGALSVRAVVAPEAGCPAVSADGAAVAMTPRGTPDAAYPVRLCEGRATAATARLAMGDTKLPTLPASVRRIAVLGDTGCRLDRRNAQDCRDPVAWPFAAIAKAAAARRPDLVIHVGDYHYREMPCPPGRTGCAGSPYGDNWATWQADFFAPAAPLLAAAPWVMVRGNHELCRRGGQGWARLLDPHSPGAACVDRSPPYRLSLGGLELLLFDSADAEDFLAPPEKVAFYAGQLKPLLAGARPGSWLLLHHPVWAMGQGDMTGLSTNLTMQGAIRGLVPPTLDLVLSGHVHDFIAYDFGPVRPAQLIVGIGGDRLQKLGRDPIVGAEIDGVSVRRGLALEQFGYLIMERPMEPNAAAGGWDGTLYTPDDKVTARCRFAARELACQ
jgi:hypothetical protein